jgi:hypothetical protein
MKQLTTTKATYMNVTITVSTDRFGGDKMFCCDNSLGGARAEAKWFPTQGEAIAAERHVIDKKLGIVTPPVEEPKYRRGR